MCNSLTAKTEKALKPKKRKLLIFTVLIISAALILGAAMAFADGKIRFANAAYDAAPGLFEDFEASAVGDKARNGYWATPSGQGALTGVRTDPSQPVNKVYCFNNASDGSPWMHNAPNFWGFNTGRSILEIDYYLPSANYTAADQLFVQIRSTISGTTVAAAQVYGVYGGKITEYGKPDNVYKTVDYNTWFSVKTEINHQTKTFSVYYALQGGEYVLICSGVALPDTWNAETGFDNVRIMSSFTGTDKRGYIDNLKIYNEIDLPYATGVKVTGTTDTAGETLHGTYTYKSDVSKPEGGSLYRWYISESPAGRHNPQDLSYTEIPGATGLEYITAKADADKYIIFGVTVYDGDGDSGGEFLSAPALLYDRGLSADFQDYSVGGFTDGRIYSGVSGAQLSVAAEDGNKYLKFSADGGGGDALIENSLLYGLTGSEIIFSQDLRLPSALPSGAEFSALIKAKRDDVSIDAGSFKVFWIEGGSLYVNYSTRTEIPIGEWITVSVILMPQQEYFVVIEKGGEVIYVSGAAEITNVNFKEKSAEYGVTGFANEFSAEENGAVHTDNIIIRNAENDNFFIGGSLGSHLRGAEFTAEFTHITVNPDGGTVYAFSKGQFPAGIEIAGSGLTGIFENAGGYSFVISAETGGVVKYALFTVTVTEPVQIIFKSNGGGAMERLSVLPGEPFELPVPQRAHYLFAGWFSDAEFENAWAAGSGAVSDIMLHAKWEAERYALTFLDRFGLVIATKIISYGENISEFYPNTEVSGFEFKGWYTDEAFAELAGNGLITANTVLYGKWAAAEKEDDSCGCGSGGGAIAASAFALLGAAIFCLGLNKKRA